MKQAILDSGLKEAVGAELERLAALPANWDGYGAPVIDPAVIAAAKGFLRALPEGISTRPRVVPMSKGNVQLEWHQGSKVLELEFENPRLIRFLRWHPEASFEEEDTFPISDVGKAVELIQWFTRGNL